MISPEKINQYLKYFTSEPHVASSPRNNELANFILEKWKSFGLDKVYSAQYDVLLSFPKEIMVEMVSPKGYRLHLKEAGYEEDPDTLRSDVGLPYNAYSRSGEITAPLVYANSGNPQDYNWLEEAATLPKIISIPISAQDALPLLKELDGEKVPQDWQGALPVTYRLGGSSPQVYLKVEMDSSIKKITNIIGCLKGTANVDEFVLIGNHRDTWVFGGYDPSSGTACLMELVRALANARKAGFVPKRTIYFASWDAEEFTLTGSTEWGEDNYDWLKKNLITYLNVDSAASGKNFSVQAVPSLSRLIIRALKEARDPATKLPVYDIWKKGSTKKGSILVAGVSGQINPIGSGTDHAVFLNHIGAPALDMSFSGDYGVYHSLYDNYYWMTHFGDPDMTYTAALARIWAHMVIELTCCPLLPFDFESYAQQLEDYLEDWAKNHDPLKKDARVFLP